MPDPLRGVIPPLVTPMTNDGEPDLGALRAHVRRLVDAGVHGVWVNGSTGEFFALDADQRTACIAACAAEVDSAIPVVAHVGAPATREAIALGRAALDAGATHLSVVAPFYADYTQGELVRHYQRVCEALGRAIVLYHIPKLTQNGLTTDSVLALAKAGIAEAIKDSSNDMTSYRRLLLEVHRDELPLRCFTGGGAMMDVGLYLGGAGAMPAIANLAPRTCVAIFEAACADDWMRARELQHALNEFNAAMRLPQRGETWTPTIAIYKHLLSLGGGLPTGTASSPLAELDASERLTLEQGALPLLKKLEAAMEPAPQRSQ